MTLRDDAVPIEASGAGRERRPLLDPGIFGLSATAFHADPYPTYERLRRETPVAFLPHDGITGGMWLVTTYDDVDDVLKSSSIGKDVTRVVDDVPEEERGLPMMLMSDPPDHTRLRSLVGAAFTPKVVRELTPRMEAIASDLLDRAEASGTFDMIADFALPFPVVVIAELLGVPVADRSDFQAWSQAFVEGNDVTAGTPEVRQRSLEAQRSLAAYFQALIERRRTAPEDDLISRLVEVSDGTDRLSPAELIGTCVLLLVAGHETTTNLIGNGVLTFMRHRDQWRRLVEEPELVPSAVEEVLRFESPVQRATFRIALEQVVFQGVAIRRGEQLSAVIGSANRDPERFPEPDRFDIAREPNRHVAFGKGIHFCLGAPLARLEGASAFRMLAERFPDLELASDAPPVWRSTTGFRGLQRLAVRTGR